MARRPGGPDYRLPLLGAAAWLGALAAEILAGSAAGAAKAAVALTLVAAGILAVRCWHRAPATILAAAVVLTAVAGGALLRGGQVAHNPVAELAREGAEVQVVATVASDPHASAGRYATEQVVRLDVTEVTGRGHTYRLHTPVVAMGDDAWATVPLGARILARGRLATADDDDVSALLDADGDPQVVRAPNLLWRVTARLREALRETVAGRPPAERAIVPALVDGDSSALDETVVDDFRTTGLTHLLAVSGTNLTLVVGFLLLVARWCRVRGRWLYLVGFAGIAGFVLLARTEPSVLRAAVMGAVGLVSLDGRPRALRCLGFAVLALMLVDPALAISVGFALSVLATAGIVLLAPLWRDALAAWLPRWAAEAIAVPAAAQLACTPLIAAISGQVSLVAVVANLLADPAVAPATVLGLLGGLAQLACPPLGRLLGTFASWCVAWIVAVAERCAALPTAAVPWPVTASSLAVLTGLTALVAFGAPRLLRRRVAGPACCLLLVLGLVVRPSGLLPDLTPGGSGWPSSSWVYVACDVGQGDGTVLNAGPHAGIVIDTGPDPAPMRACLDRLGITEVPLLVLTHFDADHVDGISAVFAGRHVDEVWQTLVLPNDPSHGIEVVRDAASAAGLTPETPAYGETRTIGPVTFQVLWPNPAQLSAGATSNEACIVLLAETGGISLLLTGDAEPESQQLIAGDVPGLHVDVLKVPHHGSRYQDMDFLLSLHPSIAITSVGADNSYGHPAASTLDPLAAAGVQVYRTDQDGSVAVVPTPTGPSVLTTK